jgi:uncharacterized protein YndB with AHSA1/START domain
MDAAQNTITVTATVNAPVEKVWQFWNEPEHIKRWAFASDDWHAPFAENDLRTGGNFKTTMAAKDGSFSFDFGGVYTDVQEYAYIAYTMGDGRRVWIEFNGSDSITDIKETFEPESQNSIEMQQGGWQMILNNFKKYAEANA